MLGKKICFNNRSQDSHCSPEHSYHHVFVLGSPQHGLANIKKQGAQGQQHQFCPCITYSAYRCWVVLKVVVINQKSLYSHPLGEIIVQFQLRFFYDVFFGLLFFCCHRTHVNPIG